MYVANRVHNLFDQEIIYQAIRSIVIYLVLFLLLAAQAERIAGE